MNLSYSRPFANTEDFVSKTPTIDVNAAKEEEKQEARDITKTMLKD